MSTAAAKQKSYRERMKRGRAIFAVEADPVEVAPVLMRMKLLSENQIEDHGAIAAAISRLLDHLTGKVT